MKSLQLLRDTHYRRYWLSLLISNLGNWMQSAAMGWLVLKISGSAEALGWVVGLRFLPSLLFSLHAGALADRFSRQRIVLVCQSLMMGLAFVTAALVTWGALDYWHLLVLSFAQGTILALDMPARQALVVEMVTKSRYPEAMSLNSFTFNLSRLLGPALAGICIASWGMSWAFWINAITFTPLVLTLLYLPILPGQIQQATQASGARLLAGVHYVLGDLLIRRLFFMLGWVSIFGVNFSTLIPAYARLELGLDAQGYGFLLSALGLGALIGSLWQVWSPAARPGRMLKAALALAGLHLLLGLRLEIWGVAAIWVGCGFAMVTMMINTNTSLQTLAPDHLRGRIMALYSMVLLGTAPLGSWLSGYLFDTLGGRQAAVCMGLLTFMGLLPFFKGALPQEILNELRSPAPAD